LRTFHDFMGHSSRCKRADDSKRWGVAHLDSSRVGRQDAAFNGRRDAQDYVAALTR
jgi:hypothetical protein